MTFGQLAHQGIRRAWCVPLLLALMLSSGCSKKDPVKQLVKAGGVVEYESKDRKEKIRTVKFPADTADEDLDVLAAIAFSRVDRVDLSGTKITNAGLEKLAKNTSITWLNLSRTDVDDDGMESLQALVNLNNLDLADTGLTDVGLKHLQEVKSLTVLNLIGQEEPRKPTPRGIGTAIRLGIDLRGGTNLVYQVKGTEDKPITKELMNQMVGAVKRRLDPAGTEEITVRVVGSDRIEIIIPRADPEVVVEKKRMMTRLGTLEFALLANRQEDDATITEAQASGGRDYKKDGRLVAGWREVGTLPDGTPKKVSLHSQVVTRQSPTNKDILEFLVIFGPENRRVKGDHLKRASRTNDENGRPAVSFNFNATGANRFARLTGDNLPKSEDGFKSRLAILLDGRIHSAPSIISTISDRGQITGSFTADEVTELVNVLNAGALVLEFEVDDKGKPTPISEQTISPTLGSDVQAKGKFAIIIAAIVVVVFMLGYYLFAGIVADLCLMLNLVLVLGALAFIDAALTLPGLAGIVLTIGMAVDANVLIFERIREEQLRGSSLRMAIHNGFSKAFTTIVDANLTTLITGFVLYMIGTDQVRGFAVTLIIGILMSMFSALFVGRLIFDVCERKRWLKTLKMNRFIGATSWDFVSRKGICGIISLVVIVAGIAGVVSRGSDLLDIDFTGGTMVTFEFKEKQNVDDVKAGLAKSDFLNDGMAVEELGSTGKLFRVRGKKQDSDTFKKKIAETMNTAKLALRQVEIVKLTAGMIEPVDGPAKKDDPAKKTPAVATSEYSGGQRVTLEFTDDGLKESTFSIYVARHLKLDAESGADKDQFKVVGVETSQEEPLAGEAQKFRTIQLTTKKTISKAALLTALESLKTQLAGEPIFPEVNNFDSAVAGDMKQSAVLAMVFSLLAIVAYIWFRFKQATFGIAAVAALVHDVLIVLGIVALAPYLGLGDFKLNLPMIAAFLTIVGYSLNDTIVVFDRIREVRGKNPAMTSDIINKSLNQTLSRTILTSLTTFVVVAILFVAGGAGIHGFAFCLVLGVIVGTYSSIYVASPVLLWLMGRPSNAAGKATAAQEKATAGTAG